MNYMARYMAPEIFESKPFDFKVDSWSAMVSLYNLFTGHTPFNGGNLIEMYQEIQIKDFKFEFSHHPVWKNASPQFKDFLRQGLRKDQDKRASIPSLLQHPWLKDVSLPNEIPFKSQDILSTAVLARAGHKLIDQSIKRL